MNKIVLFASCFKKLITHELKKMLDSYRTFLTISGGLNYQESSGVDGRQATMEIHRIKSQLGMHKFWSFK